VGQMKKYSIALPIQRNRIFGSGNPFYFLAVIEEVWLQRALDLIAQEKKIHQLEQERAELLAKLEELKSR